MSVCSIRINTYKYSLKVYIFNYVLHKDTLVWERTSVRTLDLLYRIWPLAVSLFYTIAKLK